jgi:uncharacterized protein YggE
MGKHAALTLLLLLPACLHGQATATDRTVTVTASRNAAVAADQGLFNVDVITGTEAALDDVVAAAQGSIVTAANFTSVSTVSRLDPTGKNYRDYLDWSFTLTAPLSNLKATLGQLTALQMTVGAKNNGMTVSYSLRGTQTSVQALAGQNCAASDLVSDARAQAQKLAVAAGLSVGAVVAVSGTSVVTPPSGGFSAGTYQPTCSMTVKFALTGL